jgi:hypothetical protein
MATGVWFFELKAKRMEASGLRKEGRKEEKGGGMENEEKE